jgi:hypothetical protein
LLVCAGKGYMLKSATNAGGTSPLTYTWYEDGAPVGNSNTDALTIPAGKAPGTYTYVCKAANAECPEGVASNTYTVVILSPAAPVINVGAAAICQDVADLVFTIPSAANTTYTWTGAPGTPSGDDRSTYTVSGSTPGAKAVQATAAVYYEIGGLTKTCTSAPSAEAQAEVRPQPVITSIGEAQCGSHVLLTVQATVNGVTVTGSEVAITWYADDAGNTPVGSGATYAPCSPPALLTTPAPPSPPPDAPPQASPR